MTTNTARGTVLELGEPAPGPLPMVVGLRVDLTVTEAPHSPPPSPVDPARALHQALTPRSDCWWG